MQDWKSFIDSRFININSKILTRSRVPVVCPKCLKCTVIYVSNLQQRVNKYGTYECRSCAGRSGYLKSKNKPL